MFRLQHKAYDLITRHAQFVASMEVVGLVTEGPDGTQAVHQLRNVHKDPERYYEVDPANLRAAYNAMPAGHIPVAFYHSHPSGRAEPSETDMAGALNGGMHYLIAYVAPNGAWTITAWECIDMGLLVGAELEVVE